MGATAALLALSVHPAHACGGLFCNGAVNQAAERIIFADNGDGTVTAVIEIQYQGPASEFSWLLPVSTPPSEDQPLRIGSTAALAALQAATNPQFVLQTKVEGKCAPTESLAADAGAIFNASADHAEVTVDASGIVGPFDWTVISVTDRSSEPAKAATDWLEANGYQVPPGSAPLLAPYLGDGLSLLALRLTKDADVGSIRPIIITYDADRAIIPIKLTAVAAQDDMGVMTFLLGEGRGVPQNYLSLEINEARLDWFNPQSNYAALVNQAADDAGGQGFVTEFAGSTEAFAEVVLPKSVDEQWQELEQRPSTNPAVVLQRVSELLGSYDGFWDALRKTVSLPTTLSFERFQSCVACYGDQAQYSWDELHTALVADVVEPLRNVQELISAHPKLTRLYTTLSAPEMTLDPLFTFNPDLKDVSNLHTATRVVECSSDVEQFAAPWTIKLPQGGVVRGADGDQTWPSEFDSLPPNRVIRRQGASGTGKVIEDNGKQILSALAKYNDKVAKQIEENQRSVGGGARCSLNSPHTGATGSGLATGALGLLAAISVARRRSRRVAPAESRNHDGRRGARRVLRPPLSFFWSEETHVVQNSLCRINFIWSRAIQRTGVRVRRLLLR
ncbi:MAG TPA: DUF2330 domain-containing protein [Polyangiaceae bacterium]|nr:DUF2330 domain-containing protein [Polyangiaceae bacterium]